MIFKKDLKYLSYFDMIQNYDKISKWNAESSRIYTFW